MSIKNIFKRRGKRVDSEEPMKNGQLIEQMKLRALNSLKEYKENKRKITELSTITDEELEKYLNSYKEYQFMEMNIKLFSDASLKDNRLDFEIQIFQNLLTEVSSLKNKNANISRFEQIYTVELNKVKKEQFFAQNADKPERVIELLWQCKEIEKALQKNPSEESLLLDYLNVKGEIAKEEYLAATPESEDKISNTIKGIEAEKASLLAKKQIISEYIDKKWISDNTGTKVFSTIEEGINDCVDQLSLLKL